MKMGKDINLNQLSDFLTAAASRLPDNLEKVIKLCCKKVSDDIKYSMDHTERNPDRTYYTNNKTKGHHPSMPGNPPAVDTGNLKNTIKYEVYKDEKEVYGVVGTTQKDPDYGAYLEYGTTKGGWGGKGMAPRPWLKPAMRKNNDFIRLSIAKAVKNTLTGLDK